MGSLAFTLAVVFFSLVDFIDICTSLDIIILVFLFSIILFIHDNLRNLQKMRVGRVFGGKQLIILHEQVLVVLKAWANREVELVELLVYCISLLNEGVLPAVSKVGDRV
jgi:hypothetical protein